MIEGLGRRHAELVNLVIEESSEVIKDTCKINRSGVDFVAHADRGNSATNLDNLKLELVDLWCVLGMLIADDTFISPALVGELHAAKLIKLRKWAPGIFKDTQ